MIKAKSAGRKYRDQFINGTGVAPQFSGLLTLCASGQKVSAGTNGANLSLALLDQTINLVTDKDGDVDFILMPGRTLVSYYTLLQGLGGASIGDVITLPSGKTIPSYRGIPIFRNDYLPLTQTQGTASTCTTVLMGTFDDGSMMHGIAGIYGGSSSEGYEHGLAVVDVGEKEDADEHIWRVKWYCGLANFSEKGLAGLIGILN
jgi:hypothetical protein